MLKLTDEFGDTVEFGDIHLYYQKGTGIASIETRYIQNNSKNYPLFLQK